MPGVSLHTRLSALWKPRCWHGYEVREVGPTSFLGGHEGAARVVWSVGEPQELTQCGIGSSYRSAGGGVSCSKGWSRVTRTHAHPPTLGGLIPLLRKQRPSTPLHSPFPCRSGIHRQSQIIQHMLSVRERETQGKRGDAPMPLITLRTLTFLLPPIRSCHLVNAG